jgi:xanthine dehydrogenase small subunit
MPSAMPVLIEAFPALRPYLCAAGLAADPHLGTIGGNLGNASPIGDMPPALLALEDAIEAGPPDARSALSCCSTNSSSAIARRRWRRNDSDPEPDDAAPVGRAETFHCDKVSKRR